ncbi:MAG: potassium channel protein [Trueperaceae bacterium]|nr:potassium channel protein [Trueperaceae bacterium]
MTEPSQHFWGFVRRVRLPLLATLFVVGAGTFGFYLEWRDIGATPMEAFYMTMVTITTVGYTEVYPLDTTGQLLSVFVALTGIASLSYILGTTMEYLVARRLRDPYGEQNMRETIDKLEDHVILVGLGRMGQRAARELHDSHESFVVIDSTEDGEAFAREQGYLYVIGNAEEDDTLREAGVERARGLIAATGSDATNVFVVMGARELNPDLYIVARSDSDTALGKLHKAGANRAVNLYAIGAQRLVNMIVRPAAIDFLTTTMHRGEQTLGLQDFEVRPDSPLAGKSLRELDLRKRFGINVLTIVRDGDPLGHVSPDEGLEPGDHLISLGTEQQFEKLADFGSGDLPQQPSQDQPSEDEDETTVTRKTASEDNANG